MDLDQFGGRTDDDLFADDIEPVAYEETTIVPDAVFPETQHTLEPAVVPAPVAVVPPQQPAAAIPSPAAVAPHAPPPKSLAQSRHNQRPDKPQRAPTQPKPSETSSSSTTPATEAQNATVAAAPTSSGPPPSAPKGPAAATKNTASAVSEARLGSGANPRTKLTEAELAARMEKMRIVNAEKTRQFEQAQRDESEHAVAYAKGMEAARKRRAEDAAKRKVAEEERKRLEDERAKNRDRKLKAMGMKEGGWDEGKEERLREEEQRGFKGAHGGIRGTKGSGLSGSRFASSPGDGSEGDSSFGDAGPRGRGDRGGRGGRRGGRGGSRQLFDTGDEYERGGYRNRGSNQNPPSHQQQQQPAPPPPAKKLQDESEFPALPGSTKAPQVSTTWTATKATSGPLPDLPVTSPVGRWADEVDDSISGFKP